MEENAYRQAPSGTPDPIVVAVVDNEPLFISALQRHFERYFEKDSGRVVTLGFDRPRFLRADRRAGMITHLVTDLSYGPFDLDGPGLTPEAETAVDALLHLEDHAPNCSPILASAMDADLAFDLAVVIRQTWPEVRVLSKNDRRLADQLLSWLGGRATTDNAEWGRLVNGVFPLPPQRFAAAIRGCAEARPVARLALALADFHQLPTTGELAARLGVSSGRVSKLLNLLGTTLRNTGAAQLPFKQNGLELWRWARPRRALLIRHLEVDPP